MYIYLDSHGYSPWLAAPRPRIVSSPSRGFTQTDRQTGVYIYLDSRGYSPWLAAPRPRIVSSPSRGFTQTDRQTGVYIYLDSRGYSPWLAVPRFPGSKLPLAWVSGWYSRGHGTVSPGRKTHCTHSTSTSPTNLRSRLELEKSRGKIRKINTMCLMRIRLFLKHLKELHDTHY